MKKMAYTRWTYGVPAKRGADVIHLGCRGKITSSQGRSIWIRFSEGPFAGRRPVGPYHPTWEMAYLNKDGDVIWPSDPASVDHIRPVS
jgi:hypothetical protein